MDPLTGLLNRTALYQRFGELRQQAEMSASGTSVGFLVVDLDRFKRVNDEHGHAAGDAVLERLAYVMRNSLRAFDLVYRLGGEEFVVVLPGADLSKAAEIAERLREAAEASRPHGLTVTMSVGVAVADGRELDFDDLYEQRGRRSVHRQGGWARNRVCSWDESGVRGLGLAECGSSATTPAAPGSFADRRGDRPRGRKPPELLATGRLAGGREHAARPDRAAAADHGSGKIICIGLNYLSHARGAGRRAAETPTFFGKYRNALAAPREAR